MSNFFLRSRHYLLFIFLFIPTLISIIFQVMYNIWMQRFQRGAILSDEEAMELFASIDLSAYRGLFIGFLAVSALAGLVQYGWYWSVGTELHRYLPEGTNLKPKRFKTAWAVAFVYYTGALLSMYFAFDYFVDFFAKITDGSTDVSTYLTPEFFRSVLLGGLIYLLVGILGFAALVYVVYYVGRTIRSIEYEEPRRGSDALGFSVLAYFLFIGIWVLQPKINRLVDGGRMKREDSLV